jgi:hypothetical protein
VNIVAYLNFRQQFTRLKNVAISDEYCSVSFVKVRKTEKGVGWVVVELYFRFKIILVCSRILTKCLESDQVFQRVWSG